MPEDLIAALAALALPEVGRSTQGRPLWAAPFGAGSSPPIVVVAGVHGNEPASVAAALELCQALRAAPPGPRTVWVMPVLNPDAIAGGAKNSARDVDLNRNFPARNWRADHRPGYFPGQAPLSEPETAALAGLIESSRPEGVVAVHAPLACVNYDGPAADWAAAVSAACGWPVRPDIGYATPGSLGSWLGRDRGLPVLTLELPPGPYESFRAAAKSALQTSVIHERIR